MTKKLLMKKPIGKKLPEVSKRIFPRREKNSWKLHFISIIAHFFHWIFLLYFHNTLFRSHFSGYTEQTNSIIWPSIECLFKTFIFNLKWKEWASREKKERWFCLKQMHIHAKSRYLFSHVIQKMYNCSIECYFFSS